MNLEVFYNICRCIETQTSTKRADVANLMNLNNSNCVKIKILLKELERNFPIDNCDYLFYTKIFNDLKRIINELSILSRVHYTNVLLEKHSNAKRRKVQTKHQKRKERRNKLKDWLEKYIASVGDCSQDKNLKFQELRGSFEMSKIEFQELECVFLENAVILGLRKDSIELLEKEAKKQSGSNFEQNKQESQEISAAIALQAAHIDEDIAVREKENQEVYQNFDHYMKIKFQIDETDCTFNELDSSLEEADLILNSETEVLSAVDYDASIASIEQNTKEGAFAAELIKLNDMFQYLSETIQKVNHDDNQTKIEDEEFKRAIVQAKEKTIAVENAFRYWKSCQEDEDSGSELEELEDEIEQIRQEIVALKASAA